MPYLRELWEVIRRRALIVAFSFLFFALLPAVLLLFVTPVFRASSQMKILYTDSHAQYLQGVPADVARFEYAEKTKIDDTFFGFIENPQSLRQVIADLKLTGAGGAALFPDDILMDGSLAVAFQSEGVAVDLAGKGAEIVEVIGYGPTPERAAALSNALTTRFVELYAEMYRSRARAAVQAIDRRLPALEAELRQVEGEREKFLRESGVADLEAELGKHLDAYYQYLDMYRQNERQIVQVREEIAQIKATLGDLPELRLSERVVERNSLINEYRNQIASLESTLAGSLVEVTDAHPASVATRKRIEALRATLAQELERVLSRETQSLDPYRDDLIKRLHDNAIDDQVYTVIGQTYEQLLRDLRKTLERLQGLQLGASEWDRRISALGTSYQDLGRARNAAAQVAELSPTNVALLNRADAAHVDPDKPYFPDRTKLIALCLLLAGSVAFGLILSAEAMDPAFKTGAEARTALSESLVLGIPRQPRRFARANAVGDVYRDAIAGNVACRGRLDAWLSRPGAAAGAGNVLSAFRVSGDGSLPRAMLLTGADAGCGTTTLALCVAGTLAREGRKVLLVGPAGEQSPAGGASPDEAAGFRATDADGLQILNPGDVRAFLAACSPERLAALPHDHVIFDPGPVALRADGLLAARVAGAAGVCFAQGRTARADVFSSLERLRALLPGRVWGILGWWRG